VVVGVISWQLTIPGCTSLKEKRMVVRSLKDRMRHRFNVSVAETGLQEVWTRAQLSAAVVSADRGFVDEVLDKVDRLVLQEGRALVTSSQREIY
jgi:uncharacterized protein